MTADNDELAALSEEIKKIISDNNKFLSRVMEEDFEPEEGETDEGEIVEEL